MTEQNHNLDPKTQPTDLVVAQTTSPEFPDTQQEVLSIAQVLQERGVEVPSGSEIFKSASFMDGGRQYETVRFFGVQTQLVSGEEATYTIRAFRSAFSPADLERHERLTAQGHDDWVEEEKTEGLLAMSTWTSVVNGKPKTHESYARFNRNKATGGWTLTKASGGEAEPDAPNDLTNPYVTPIKLSGREITVDEASIDGMAYDDLISKSVDKSLKRALRGEGIKRLSRVGKSALGHLVKKPELTAKNTEYPELDK